MKKILAWILSLVLVLFSFGAGVAETLEDNSADQGGVAEESFKYMIQADYEQYVNRDIAQELTVGSTTQMSGFFFTDMWGNNTADVDVRTLIHGYSTVAWGRNGDFLIDETVVAEATVTDDAQGNRTYMFTIDENLTYNDGTPITAKDYVFSALLVSSPVLTNFGGVPTTFQHLVDYEAFRNGEPFSGVRLLGDYTFSLTIAAENLPYFYELALVSVAPYPLHVIAPGCDIVDNGNGATIDGPFTAELIQETVLNPETGYLYHPKVTSGPYTLKSYNDDTQVATFEKNTYYKGNYEGWSPFIEKLTYRYADPDTMLDDLREGRLELINKVSSVKSIAEAMDMQDAGDAKLVNYWRSGFTFLGFACELGVTQSANVRKAIYQCVDVQELIDEYVSPQFGTSVFGYYGLGQWMASENQEALLELAVYGFNPDGANESLDEDGWIYNADGEPYDPERDAVRYRMEEDGELTELFVSYAKAEGNELGNLLDEMLTKNLAAVGIRLETAELSFSEILTQYYRQTERTYNMMSLATNFNMIFDPYYTFSTDDAFQGVFNTTGIKDGKLMELAKDLRQTEVGDDVDYEAKWMEFQKYWVEVLPMAPLYSNIYVDFMRTDLQNYASNAHFSWASAIVYSYLGEEEQELVLEGANDELILDGNDG